MPKPLKLRGTIASQGYAEGVLFVLSTSAGTYRSSGDAGAEERTLRDAIAKASRQVAELMAAQGGDNADILEFQLAMLDDDALSTPAYDAIARGRDAAGAWSDALENQIADYDSADDEYFRARAADLRDIRDRVVQALTGGEAIRPQSGAVLYGDDITPSQFLACDWSKGGGIMLRLGSGTSHVAMLARAKGVPMLVGVAGVAAKGGETVLLDAENGAITISPDSFAVASFRQKSIAERARRQSAMSLARRPASTRDGTPISVGVNIAEPVDVETIDIATCDGVGLMRTEFLFNAGLPDEETQYRAYRKVLEWAEDKPVTIRTVDAGGDKPVPGFTVEETNPFLGLRGIRLALSRPDVFRVQVRALLRAAVHGNLKVMFPMISVPEEYAAAEALFEAEAADFEAAGVTHWLPPLGIMVEVPAVAIAPERFENAAFLSIGSNDLTQYVMAAGRDNGAVAALADVSNPAILSLIANVVRFGKEQNIPVSLCGDAGGDPGLIPALLGTGLRSVSVAPAQLPRAKLAIAEIDLVVRAA